MKNDRHKPVKGIIKKIILLIFLFCLVLVPIAYAAGNETSESNHAEHSFGKILLWLVIILVAAKCSGLVERIGQPAVLGELMMGVVLGSLGLLGFHFFEPVKSDNYIKFLAELGVVILLFQVGLESNLEQMKKVGVRAFIVACIGVVVPFVLGTLVVGPMLLPGLDTKAYLFLGATLTATSVGITARVFRDLGKLQTRAAQIVLGAAVIDDVLGLIILAVVSAIVEAGTVSLLTVGLITVKAIGFLVIAIVGGRLLAPYLGKYLSRIHSGIGMKLTLAVAFGFFFAFLAEKVGLAPIVGAFAAGLVLDPVHFKEFAEPEIVTGVRPHLTENHEMANSILNQHAKKHIEDLIQPIGYLFVPVFFVLTGMNVKIETLFNMPILLVALGVTLVAFVGKIIAGLAANKGDRLVVGIGMIPRGEVGLIFAMVGKTLGVVSDTTYSVIVIMVILSTLIPPIILTTLLGRQTRQN